MLDVSVSNNFLPITDFFKETVFFDLDKLGRDGLDINLGIDFVPVYFTYDSKKGWGFGLSLGLETTGILGISGDLLSFSHARNSQSDFAGAVFGVAQASGFFHIQKFKVSVKPALFYTLAYVKPDNFAYTFSTRDGKNVIYLDYDIRMYSVLVFNEYNNISSVSLGTPGLDFSIGVEYPLSKEIGLNNLFPFLDFDVGLDFINIPIVPSTLTHYKQIVGSVGAKDGFVLDENSSDLGSAFSENTKTFDREGKASFERSFKMLVSAKWRPLGGNKLLTITPVLGLSHDNLYFEPASFEGGVGATVNLINMFYATAGIHYFDRLWINSLDLAFNLQAFQIDLGVNMRSTDFIKAWSAGGVGVRFGLKFGW
jgi:hypothetical protein